jgi:murein tripeptide amidase MpaA
VTKSVLLALALSSWAFAQPLLTEAERSGFQKTGRYSEVIDLCQQFQARWPGQVRALTYGQTPQGRPLQALVVNGAGLLDSAEVARRRVPVLLFQGGIHAGEIDGKDAGFMALREALEKGFPEDLVVVFVPVVSVDGHERFGRWNRPNQVGPEEMGWRVTAHNLNLNRDYTKAEAPEMQALLGLLNEWDPILYADLHVTDGAHFQPEIANLVEPIFVGDSALQSPARQFQKELNAALVTQGCQALDFYPSFIQADDPSSGFGYHAYLPRFSTGYWALRNRLALLVETHSWKPYARRVEVTRRLLHQLMQQTAQHGSQWKAVAEQADGRAVAGLKVALSHKQGPQRQLIDFPGYAYEFFDSPVSGGRGLRYFTNRPQNWKIPFFAEVLPDREVVAPQAYLVPPEHVSWLKPKLALHGIGWQVAQPGPVQLEAFRAESAEYSKRSIEGRTPLTVKGEWKPELVEVGRDWLYVPVDQPSGRLAVALFEPQGPDSFLSWGYFNAYFEQKEYMEDYVAEEVGARMLAERPELAAQFARKLREEPAFAKSPAARLDFFYRRHPSWDQRFMLYPVLRRPHLTRS